MFPEARVDRRGFLRHASLGAGALAFAASHATAHTRTAARAKHVIWLYMDGGISHLDTFDPKPRLAKDHGKPFPLPMEPTQFDSNGPVLKSPWAFRPRGQSGIPISTLFPKLAEFADDLAILRSMTNESAVHANANYWMHTGWGQMGRPSVGAWVQYGLGRASENLPDFVVLNGGLLPIGGIDNYKTGFLPGRFGPSLFGRSDPVVPNVVPQEPHRQAAPHALKSHFDKSFSQQLGKPDAIETAIRNDELAARLQTAVPELLELSKEPKAVQTEYGMEHSYEHTRNYARQCLLARRMIERGVRFVTLTMPRVDNDNRWDAHGGLKKNHEDHARTVDQPIAALIRDLKRTGLWKETLLVFATEFGRTPFSQGSDGRDHNQFGFSVWLAGAGVRGGMTYGATDEFG
ncbi:MAG: DUF1501 domain-containing protein, partial [Gemmataceae bacterium]